MKDIFSEFESGSTVPVGVVSGKPIFYIPHDDMVFSLGVNDGKAPYLFMDDEEWWEFFIGDIDDETLH